MRTCICLLMLLASSAFGTTFQIQFDSATRQEPADGRLILFLIDESSSISRASPADAPFYNDPQPIFSTPISGLKAGEIATVDDAATAFPSPLSQLPAGSYRAQAVLDVNQLDSDWSREPGNLYSDVVTVRLNEAGAPDTFQIKLNRTVGPDNRPLRTGATTIEIKSDLLSEFRGTSVNLRAAVLAPRPLKPDRQYPAVYIIPGFSGNHRSINMYAAMSNPGAPLAELSQNAFIIALDPESPNGHSLFADSANNGPCAQALIQELIPALEAKLPLIPQASARIVHGHSSGGWASLWLATQYPETFGACFSGAPDPVDFKAFQKIDIYTQKNFYTDASGSEVASNLKGGKALMTIRQENLWEEARGPSNTSGQQWDSWQAVFGPRDTGGNPAALFDPITGMINETIAKEYRKFDITHQLRSNPEKYTSIFRDRVRIIVGSADEWNLHDAVARLRNVLIEQGVTMDGKSTPGWIKIIPDASHGSVTAMPEYRAMFQEMIETFQKSGHLPGE